MVNTFIPYGNFKKCAKILDNKRLGKQRVEAKQIINILTNTTDKMGWRNHVIVKMWTGHTEALMLYYNTIVTEWIKRGFKNNMELYKINKNIKMPWFVVNKSINLSHQASLVRKYPAYYGPVFVNIPKQYMKYKYIWPSKLTLDKLEYLKKHKNDVVDIKTYAEPVL